MAMAKIFNPLRRRASARGEEEMTSPTLLGDATGAGFREPRMGANPVTNTSPSGPIGNPLSAVARAAQEEAWLALLELVFDQTGWPDA